MTHFGPGFSRKASIEDMRNLLADHWRKNATWEEWYAWRPVRTISGETLWRKRIYRIRCNTYTDFDDWSWYLYATSMDLLSI